MDEFPAVDWDLAARTGATLVPAGPQLDPAEIAGVVDELREAAGRATEHVSRVAELDQPAPSEVLVVDRPTWVRACTQSAQAMLTGAGGPPAPVTTPLDRARARALGVQAGGVLAVVATRILGQFDPFGEPNRLLLVAPNVVSVERRLGVLPRDFRLWVCLHEQTHRYQFGRAPWLRGHLFGLLGELLDGDELSFGWRADDTTGVRRLLGSPPQREAFDQVTAVMSLLEGHADVMMDRVGTAVVPTFAAIRRAFDLRRDASGWFGFAQKLLGLDLKNAQYREGAGFCRAVIEAADVATLNRAFDAPGLLPSLDELRDPQRWLHRV